MKFWKDKDDDGREIDDTLMGETDDGAAFNLCDVDGEWCLIGEPLRELDKFRHLNLGEPTLYADDLRSIADKLDELNPKQE